MAKITYQGKAYACRNDETVLQAFQRYGVCTPFSCRDGICFTCMLKNVNGTPPSRSQAGLREELRALGYFLPCICIPESEMEIETPRQSDLFMEAVVQRKERLTPEVCRLFLEPLTPFYYHSGQFIRLRREDGLTRSFSLASLPQDPCLEIHVKRIPNGAMSSWIFDVLEEQQTLVIEGPLGQCFYTQGRWAETMLLIGTGTGLGPLLGIVREALGKGHTGDIFLYHGSRSLEGLYCREELQNLSETHAQFHYIPCLSGGALVKGIQAGRAWEIAFSKHANLEGRLVYLCGHPEMVHSAKTEALRRGVQQNDLHADPFYYADTENEGIQTKGSSLEGHIQTQEVQKDPEYDEPDDPKPDPEMWATLGNGTLLSEVLTDFYTRVYDEPRLSPFFEGITKQHVIEKQFNFLYQVFTGEKVYFGEKPKTAHHWMVISDELMDIREELMAACLKEHGLSDALLKRFRAVEERYRKVNVKTQAWPKRLFGEEMPLDGYDTLELTVGSLCDGCQADIPKGEVVRYHLRRGTIYCKICMSGQAQRPQDLA